MKDQQFNTLIKTLSDNSMNYSDYIQLTLVIITLIIGFQSIFNIYDKYILPFFNKIKTNIIKIKKYFIDKKNNKLTFKKLQKLQNLIKDYPYYNNDFTILCYNHKNNCFYDLTYKNYLKYNKDIYICIDPEKHEKYYKSVKNTNSLTNNQINNLYFYDCNTNFCFVYEFQNILNKYSPHLCLKNTRQISINAPIDEIIF